jgi:acetyl esterase
MAGFLFGIRYGNRMHMAPDSDHTGMDPGMLEFYKVLSARTPPGSESWPLDRQRAEWDALCKEFRVARPDSIEVTDISANGVPVRIFRRKDMPLAPGILYSHGGGWVLGSCETHDDICAEIAAGARCTVILMDYRLAPEHPHPAQLEDSLKVWRWMLAEGSLHGIDRHHIVAAGDSAGGQMSVALALTLREMNLPQLKAMVLIYPVLGTNMRTPSYVRNANAPCLSRAEMAFYLQSFLGPEGHPNWRDEKAVPQLAADLAGLPPAFITVAGHDPLHDDGALFCNRLKAAGVPCDLREEPLLAHSYMRARHHSPVAMEGFRAILAALRELGSRQT